MKTIRKKAKQPSLPSVTSVGMSIWDPIHALEDHVSGAHELVHVMKGSITLRLKDRKYKAETGDTIIIPEKTVHRDEFPLDAEFRVLHIMFIWDQFRDFLSPDTNRALTKLPVHDKIKIKEMAADIFSIFKKGELFARARTNARLLDLLYYIAILTQVKREKKPDPAEKRKALVENGKRFIREQYNKPISLSDIAEYLKLSEYYVSHLFSSEAGFTLSTYVTEVRMEKAAELLADPTALISEIAYSVGYSDANYFSKVFRKYYNTSPGDFRSRILRRKRKK